jgi:hypothetical protein
MWCFRLSTLVGLISTLGGGSSTAGSGVVHGPGWGCWRVVHGEASERVSGLGALAGARTIRGAPISPTPLVRQNDAVRSARRRSILFRETDRPSAIDPTLEQA